MVYVILRNGKRLQYNVAFSLAVESGTITLRESGIGGGLVARIPLEIVERAEFSRPCRISRETWGRKKDVVS